MCPWPLIFYITYMSVRRSLMNWTTGGSRGLMDRASDLQPEVVGSNLGSGRNCCWGEWTTSVLSTFDTTIEVSVHLNGLNAEHKFQVWVTILGHTSLFISEWFLSNMFLITCLRNQNKEEITCSKSSMQALMQFLCLVICLMNSLPYPLQAHYVKCSLFSHIFVKWSIEGYLCVLHLLPDENHAFFFLFRHFIFCFVVMWCQAYFNNSSSFHSVGLLCFSQWIVQFSSSSLGLASWKMAFLS